MTSQIKNIPFKYVKLSVTFSALVAFSSQAVAVPDFPEANADSATTTQGQSIVVDVLANDTGVGLFIEEVDEPAPYGTGTSAIVDNKIVYTPPPAFVGNTRFYYGIKDAAGQITSAPLSITVEEASSASPWPVAENDRASTEPNEAITIEPLWNDVGDALRITDVDTSTTQGSQVEVVGNALVYTPATWAEGEDQFWYQITDSLGRTNAAKVIVTVRPAVDMGPWPTAGTDTYTIFKNSSDNVLSVLDNDTGSGIELDELYDWTAKGGRTSAQGNAVNYRPPAGFTGTDDFWYTMKDVYGRTNAAKVVLNVVEPTPEEPNGAPDAVEDGFLALINGEERVLDVLLNDTDPEGDTLTVTDVQPARYGSVRLTADGVVRYSPPSTPQSDAFEYTISDGNGGMASAFATISVTDPNDNNENWPVINNEFVSVSPGETIIIKVLENDSDADGDTLVLDVVNSGSQGTTTKVADESGNLNWVEYTALPSASGTDEFYYGVHDGRGKNGSGKVTITIQ
ncbi:MAG: hypothetical protein CSB47_07985 [Proteobacteria bacterium]|nr:MAG: hypothetical protein CSB47_07985 [Pseudomonadota bacterium]